MQCFRASVLILAAALGPTAGVVAPAVAQSGSFTTAVNAAVQQACLSSTNTALLYTIASSLVLAGASSPTNAGYINSQVASNCQNLKTAYQAASTGYLQLSQLDDDPVSPNKRKHGNCGYGNGGDDGIPGKAPCDDINR